MEKLEKLEKFARAGEVVDLAEWMQYHAFDTVAYLTVSPCSSHSSISNGPKQRSKRPDGDTEMGREKGWRVKAVWFVRPRGFRVRVETREGGRVKKG